MLRHYIRHYWILQSDRANVVTERTFPLGCIQIFFHKKKRLFSQTHHKMQPRYFVCGQEKGYQAFPLRKTPGNRWLWTLQGG